VGNGGQTDKYRWTQTLQEVNVYFIVPANLKGKDIIVDFQQKRLKARERTSAAAGQRRALMHT
jgi:hypothetical protein